MTRSAQFIALAVVLSVGLGARADVLYSYASSTSHVTADTSYSSPLASATGVSPYVYTRAFSDTTALSPSSAYTGPTFYGGYQFSSSTIDRNFTRQQIRNDTTPSNTDQIYLQTFNTPRWGGSTLNLHGLYVFKPADFNPAYVGQTLALDGIAMTWTGYINTLTGETTNFDGRLVVQIAGSYYLSQSIINLYNTNGSISISPAALAAEQWAAFNPTASLDFDAASASFTSLPLIGVTAVGIYFEEDGWSGSISNGAAYGLGIVSFEASGSIVPEPAGLGVLLLGLNGLLAARLSRPHPSITR